MAKQCKYCLSVIPENSLTCSHCGAPDLSQIKINESTKYLRYATGMITKEELLELMNKPNPSPLYLHATPENTGDLSNFDEEKEMSPDGFLRGLCVSVVFAIIAWVIINFIIK